MKAAEEQVTCPVCDGRGQVGRDDSVCTACWMRGVVPAWRAAKIREELAWWRERTGQDLGEQPSGE
jgi:hypothetical protein